MHFFSDQLLQVYNFPHLDSDHLQFWERFTSACLNSGSSYPNQGNNTVFNAFPYLHLRFLFLIIIIFSADKDIIQNCRSNYFSFLLFYFYLLLFIYLFPIVSVFCNNETEPGGCHGLSKLLLFQALAATSSNQKIFNFHSTPLRDKS